MVLEATTPRAETVTNKPEQQEDAVDKTSALAGVALASFAVLLLELILTRVFSVVFLYHWAFLAISSSLLQRLDICLQLPSWVYTCTRVGATESDCTLGCLVKIQIVVHIRGKLRHVQRRTLRLSRER